MKIKGFIIWLVIILSGIAAAQEYRGSTFYFLEIERETGAAAEASGKQYLFNTNDAFGSLYNPALPALSGMFNASVSTSSRYGVIEKAYSHSEAVNIPVKDLGMFSLSGRYFNYGINWMISTVQNPYGIGTGEWYESIYNLNFSRQISGGLYAGAGLNYMEFNPVAANHKYLSLNAGAGYLIEIRSSIRTHKYYIGTSVTNAAYVKLIEPKNYNLDNTPPQILNLTAGHSLQLNPFPKPGAFNYMEAAVQAEYSAAVHSNKYTKYSFGFQIALFKVLTVRTGYYSFEHFNQKQEDAVFGVGVNLPLYLLGFPFDAGIDYVNILQSPHLKDVKNPESFTFNIRYRYDM